MNVIATPARSPATELVEHLAALTWGDLPADARRNATISLLDNIACGIFGAQWPWARIPAELAISEQAAGTATLLGHGIEVTPSRAALCNGTAIHGYELDDVILGSLAHPGTAVVPAALAAAEHVGASGDRLLLGIVAGYEVMGRLGAALGAACNNAGFHTTSVAGGVAAAVAAGVVEGLPAATILRSIGIACSSASGIKAFAQGNGGMVKRLHGGNAAESGTRAWELARRGFNGPLQAIDGRYGLLQVIGGPTARAELMSRDLGRDWVISRVWVKAYPCCGVIHTSAQALEMIRDEHGLKPADVVRVRIGLGTRAVDQNGERAPAETMNAQYSIPYCAALALTGDVKGPASFGEDRLDDAATLDMIRRVELHFDPEIEAVFPDKFAARVEVETTDGRLLEQTLWDAHGMPADPCSEAEVAEKCRRLCAPQIPAEALARIVAEVEQVGERSSLAGLGAALRAPWARG